MSASPIARQATKSQSIPTKNIVIHDASELPVDYSSTPGGTLYSTTPGGTRIVYERAFLMNLRNSPISRTPPKSILPANIMKGAVPAAIKSPVKTISLPKVPVDDQMEQFHMDM